MLEGTTAIMEGSKVYIAGPMTGLPDKGRRAFYQAEGALRAMGFRVINPACLPDDLETADYMPICLAMLQQADAVFMLPGWQHSGGARIEHNFALYQGSWTNRERPSRGGRSCSGNMA